MRISDWSLDVCSSDLLVSEPAPTWTTENIGPDVIEGLRMTASLVIDGQGRATYAAVDGAEFGPEVTGRLSSELDNLVRAPRAGVGGAGVRPARASTVLLLAGDLAIAAGTRSAERRGGTE